MNESEAGPEIATGLTEDDLECASKFLRNAANLDQQMNSQLSSSMERFRISDPCAENVADKIEAPPREERSAPEGTSSPDPKSLEGSISKNISMDGMYRGSEVSIMLKKQEQEFEEKLLRHSLELSEKGNNTPKQGISESTALKEAIASRDALLNLVEQYKGMLSSLVTDKEKQQRSFNEEKEKIAAEKNQAVEDLSNVEAAFSDVHRKYERTKQIIETLKRNEETLKSAVSNFEEKVKNMETLNAELKNETDQKIEVIKGEYEAQQKCADQDLTKMAALLKKAEMKIISLQESLERKSRENIELSKLCDELISKVGS